MIPHNLIMVAGDWIALGAVIVTVFGAWGGVVYKMGQFSSDLREVGRRVQRMEDKMDSRAARRTS